MIELFSFIPNLIEIFSVLKKEKIGNNEFGSMVDIL